MTDTATSTQSLAALGSLDDSEYEGALSESAAEAAIMSKWAGTDDASKATVDADKAVDGKEVPEAPAADVDTKTGGEEVLEENAVSEPDKKDEKAPAGAEKATDDHIVSVLVNGQEIEVPVKDLKRLYGQEASITQKGQEAAQIRKEAEDLGANYAYMLQSILEEAAAEYEPYAELDWHVLGRQLDDDDYIELRQEAKDAFAKYNGIMEKAKGFDADAARAKASAPDPKAVEAANAQLAKDIPNWGAAVHTELVAFAKEQGLDAAASIDPALFKVLHQANLYNKGKDVAAKKVAQVAKTVKASESTPPVADKSTRDRDLMGKFQKSGSMSDAEKLILGRWAK